jgi:hypothetical protein
MAQDDLEDDLDFDEDPFDEDDDNDENDSSGTGDHEVDLSAQGFPDVTKRFEAAPHQFFADPNYYKTALSDEGEPAKRVHAIFQKYINAKDPKDRSVFRVQLISAYWEFLRSVAKKTPGKIPMPKKFLLRFNLLHHNFINSEMRDFFAKLVTENTLNQPVYYVDEWLKAVGTGIIRASTTDEVRIARNNTQMKMRQLLEKAMGKLDGVQALLKAKDQERGNLEQGLGDCIETITEHFLLDDFEDINAC